jgi:hypothetical protein
MSCFNRRFVALPAVNPWFRVNNINVLKRRTIMARAKKTDSLKMRGYLEYCLRDARTGEVVQRGKGHNTVTCGGRGWALARLTPGSNASILAGLAIGSISSLTPASNQSNLAGYMTIQTFNGGTTLASATNTTANLQCACSFASNETWSGSSQIGEFGLYNNAASTGVLFNRVTTSTYINFATSNTLAITITITN